MFEYNSNLKIQNFRMKLNFKFKTLQVSRRLVLILAEIGLSKHNTQYIKGGQEGSFVEPLKF